MALTLPPFFVLKSNGKYLCAVVGDIQASLSLQFSGEDVFAPRAKYGVELAHDGLVHIRSCYNNKYWARRAEDDYRIVAKANDPEIDSSKWSCTLFKHIINWDAKTVRFHHVQLGSDVSVMPSFEIKVSLTESGVECAFIDWESLLMLPKYVAFKDVPFKDVAFKGDRSRYLSARQIKDSVRQLTPWNNGHNYMRFTGKDIGDPTVRNDISITPDGFVRIMSCSHGKFWRRVPGANWIWADSNNNDLSGDNLFWPVKISDNVIALRSKGNNLFCGRNTRNNGWRIDCLRASAESIIHEAHLEVEETVLSRTVQNVKFRLSDVRFQHKNVDVYVSDEIINNSSTDSLEELTFTYSKTQSSTWSSSVSLKLGVKTTITSTVPICLRGQLEIAGEISRTIQWGVEEKTSNEIAKKHTVTVPPGKTMNVTVTATVGKFEVPFSYIQSDTLTNGVNVTYRKDDGVYIHERYFGFQQRNTQRNAIQN